MSKFEQHDDAECPECGSNSIRQDLEAPRATCNECGECRFREEMNDFKAGMY